MNHPTLTVGDQWLAEFNDTESLQTNGWPILVLLGFRAYQPLRLGAHA